MAANGLVKLLEESGELQEAVQLLQMKLGRLQRVVGKKLAYYHTDEHPDGKGSLKRRLEDELADVDAAVHLVAKLLELDEDYISTRVKEKFALFMSWHLDPGNNRDGIDAPRGERPDWALQEDGECQLGEPLDATGGRDA